MTEPCRFQFVTPDGTTLYCVGFEDELELTGLLSRRTVRTSVNLSSSPSAEGLDWPPRIEPERPRGRPSFDAVLGEAVQALRLDPAQSLAERARRVLKYLAQTCGDPADIPNARTVERFLAGAPARQKSRQKLRQKSARAKLPAVGG